MEAVLGPGYMGSRAADLDHTRILAVMQKHETHNRFLCNVAKRGEIFLARFAQLESEADAIIRTLGD